MSTDQINTQLQASDSASISELLNEFESDETTSIELLCGETADEIVSLSEESATLKATRCFDESADYETHKSFVLLEMVPDEFVNERTWTNPHGPLIQHQTKDGQVESLFGEVDVYERVFFETPVTSIEDVVTELQRLTE